MAKFTGKFAEILLKSTAATPTYVAVAQVQEIGEIAITAEEVDVTTLDAGDYRDYISGFKDPGECQLTLIWDPGMTGHDDDPDGIIGVFDDGAVRDWAIRWNSSAVGGKEYGLFKGFIRDMSYGALNADDPQTLSPLIRLTSPIALADALPTTTEQLNAVFRIMRETKEKRRAALAAARAAADKADAAAPPPPAGSNLAEVKTL
jgi:predicted secreted protein